jgi:hypothetical protein
MPTEDKRQRDDRPTYPAEEHALPFRTILQEYRVRRGTDLDTALGAQTLTEPPPEEHLEQKMPPLDHDSFFAKLEDAYSELA